MKIMNEFDVQKLINQMEIENKKFESEIGQAKTKEKIIILKKFPFITPFFKALLLTIVVLLVVIYFQ